MLTRTIKERDEILGTLIIIGVRRLVGNWSGEWRLDEMLVSVPSDLAVGKRQYLGI